MRSSIQSSPRYSTILSIFVVDFHLIPSHPCSALSSHCIHLSITCSFSIHPFFHPFPILTFHPHLPSQPSSRSIHSSNKRKEKVFVLYVYHASHRIALHLNFSETKEQNTKNAIPEQANGEWNKICILKYFIVISSSFSGFMICTRWRIRERGSSFLVLLWCGLDLSRARVSFGGDTTDWFGVLRLIGRGVVSLCFDSLIHRYIREK